MQSYLMDNSPSSIGWAWLISVIDGQSASSTNSHCWTSSIVNCVTWLWSVCHENCPWLTFSLLQFPPLRSNSFLQTYIIPSSVRLVLIRRTMKLPSSILCLSLLASTSLQILGSTCSCLHFNFPNFDTTSVDDFSFSPGSGIANGSLQITLSTGNITNQSGRVCYTRETLRLWDSKKRTVASFRTEFVLNILPNQQQNETGEGLAFILTSNLSSPRGSSGQWLGIANEQTDGSPANRIVAVEFDTRKSYDEDLDSNHVGLDVNGIRSVVQYPLSNVSIFLSSGFDLFVSISYKSRFRLLIVEAMQLSTRGLHVVVQAWPIDLSRYLSEEIYVGFAGSTGEFTELNQIKSWKFITAGDFNSKAARQEWTGHRWQKRFGLCWLCYFLVRFLHSTCGEILNNGESYRLRRRTMCHQCTNMSRHQTWSE